jgi:hypothetical protein
MANAKGFYSELPTWAKGTVAVVAVGSLVLLGIAIRNAIKTGKGNKEDKEFGKETQEELDLLLNQGVQPTLSDAQATSLANLVESSLSGCELSGTEEQVVKSILAGVQNQADWVKLQNVYGIRTTDNCGYWTGDTKEDLKGILTSNLDGFDWSFTLYINVLKKGLQNKGINW